MTPNEQRRYNNPPIEEALVEFQVPPSSGWDLTIPGKLHARVKDDYPGRPRQQRVLHAKIRAALGQPPDVATQEGIGRVQLLNADGTRLLGLGPDVLSVHALRPYDGWEKFRPRIESALKAYAEVAEANSVSRIGVRYVNRIVLRGPEVDLGAHFNCWNRVPTGLPAKVTSFLNRAEHLYSDGVKLVMTFAPLEPLAQMSTFLLDLDLVWDGPGTLEIEAALSKMDDLHDREGAAFEALITDQTREVLNA